MKRSVLITILLTACGGGSAPAGTPTELALPDIELIVRDSAPPAFLDEGAAKLLAAAAPAVLDATLFKTSFFSPGPTDALAILHDVKLRLAGYAHTASDNVVVPCWSAAPVAYTLQPPGEAPVTMYALCYDAFHEGQSYVLLGAKDGTTYLYVAGSVGVVAAIATPVPGTGEDGGLPRYQADIYATVGMNNTPSFYSGSYAIMHIQGNTQSKRFEMAVAGLNVQFCGAQVKSNGTDVYGEGSADLQVSGCAASASLCVSATALTTPSTCSSALMAFDLAPLGREGVMDGAFTAVASLYPGTPNVALDGTATDALHALGMSAPPVGVAPYTIMRLTPPPDGGVVDAGSGRD